MSHLMKKQHIQKKELLLYCMDELSVKSANRIRSHLKECAECRFLLDSEEHFIQLLKQHPKPEPTEILLNRCRSELKKTMRNQIHSSDSAPFWKKFFDHIFIPTPRVQIATAAFFFIIGLTLGRFLFLSETARSTASKEMIRALQTGSAIENIQITPSVHQTGEVEIQYRTQERKILRGNIKNPEIQTALSYVMMNAPKDNIRLRSIGLLKDESNQKPVQEALIHALRNDQNPGVRLKAIRILKNLPINEKIKNIFIYVLLKDTNSGIRFEAAKMLAQTQDPGIESVLRNQASKEQFIQALLSKNENPNRIPVSRDL
jgi:hypothetical protein